MEDLRYPIGEYTPPAQIVAADRARWIEEIASLPPRLVAAVEDLDDPKLDTRYRLEGWTIRQVVHHVADSHINAYIRFKLSLTEENPSVRPYHEALWAELPDSRAPVSISLPLIASLHGRWAVVLRAMGDGDFRRTYFHPEFERSFPLDYVLGMYAWHGNHHLGHITRLRAREGW